MTVDAALSHRYLDEGRMRFHSCMCSCCYSTPTNVRIFTQIFDPVVCLFENLHIANIFWCLHAVIMLKYALMIWELLKFYFIWFWPIYLAFLPCARQSASDSSGEVLPHLWVRLCGTPIPVTCIAAIHKYPSSELSGIFCYLQHDHPFDPRWEKELSRMSMFDLRDRMYRYVTERAPPFGVALAINPNSAAYKNFTTFVFKLCNFSHCKLVNFTICIPGNLRIIRISIIFLLLWLITVPKYLWWREGGELHFSSYLFENFFVF